MGIARKRAHSSPREVFSPFPPRMSEYDQDILLRVLCLQRAKVHARLRWFLESRTRVLPLMTSPAEDRKYAKLTKLGWLQLAHGDDCHLSSCMPSDCSDKEPVQGVRRGEHLPARSAKEPLQGVRRVRRGGHLPARSDKEHVQGVRRWEHLPAQSDTEQDAAGSREALDFDSFDSHFGSVPARSPGSWSLSRIM